MMQTKLICPLGSRIFVSRSYSGSSNASECWRYGNALYFQQSRTNGSWFDSAPIRPFGTTSPSISSREQSVLKRLESDTKNFFKRYEWLLKMLGYYGQESKAIRDSVTLFHTIEIQSQRKGFKRLLGVNANSELNFQKMQHMLMLHTWMVHHRLMKEGKEGKRVQEALFDVLWDNTTRGIRAAGIHELMVNKNLGEVQKYSFGAAVSYDYGLGVKDDNNLELGSALWRNVFGGDPGVDDSNVFELARYVRAQVTLLNRQDKESVFAGKIKWLDPPKSIPGEADANTEVWRPATSVAGRRYWWNMHTRETRWAKPETDS